MSWRGWRKSWACKYGSPGSGKAGLVGPDGEAVKAWREDYPYDKRLRRRHYEAVKRSLQIELLKLQRSVKEMQDRPVIVFAGRDAARKGRTLNRLTQHLHPPTPHAL